MKKSKQLLLITALLFIWELPVIAQQPTDTTYIFRFVPNDDMFYVPWNGNDRSLHQLLNILEKNKKQLQAGQMYISVSSYAASANDILTSERMAYIRNNRIKSELITQGGLTEQMFVTDRAILSSYGKEKLRNVVVVTFPASVEKVAEIAGIEAARRVENYNKERSGKAERERLSIEQAAREKAEAERLSKEQAEREHLAAQEKARKQAETERLAAERDEKKRAETERLAAEATAKAKSHSLSLRANLLRWGTLTPDLGVEWRLNRHVGILVNGSYTSWTWNSNDRRYALWEIAPEARYYIGKEKRGYIGAIYKAGSFNYKLSEIGKQGNLMGGGLTGGYQLKLNKALNLDFSLALGCLHADYDKYIVIDGIRVRQGKETKNWWGPISAGVTLVWNIF
ncbi:DUF3575 domain-containing protein [Barnesiella intestinihominis]|uniref:DUF3575 domain-containing protein n=1 Tax=Barnesiella intestinihominis TaxID=487174 RepID=UPI003A90B3D4